MPSAPSDTPHATLQSDAADAVPLRQAVSTRCATEALLFDLAARAQMRQRPLYLARKRRAQGRRCPDGRAPNTQALPGSAGSPGSADRSRLAMGSPTQRIGAHYESRALDLMRAAGLSLVARNLRCRFGEIDLIMRDGEQWVLVEVRARRAGQFGGAAASVTARKRARLIRTAHVALATLAPRRAQLHLPACRFDIVAFDAEDVTWCTHAFSMDERPAL